MKSLLAEHFQQIRLQKGIRLGPLARLCGYKNVSKGARRIDNFEKGGKIHGTLLLKLFDVLGIDKGTVASLIEQDRQQYLQEWNEWADTPIRPVLILGHIGGFGWTKRLPEGMTRDEAEQHAAGIATETDRPIVLVLSRRLSISFDRDGSRTSVNETKPGEMNVPYLRFGRRKAAFDMGTGTMKVLSEPQKPGPESGREEVVTDFGGVRLRLSFEITQTGPGQVNISIDGPFFEFDDDLPDDPPGTEPDGSID